MKIALIIFPIHPSHGCILQTFALQQIMLHAGHEVTIIDRKWDKPSILSNFKDLVNVLIKRIRGKEAYLKSKIDKLLMTELDRFVDACIKNRKVYYTNPGFDELKDFEAFIVGSDQTWRPKYVSDVTYYYLGFIPKDANVKRIAYAPSFGTDEWEYSPELTATCKYLIERFDAVSVREESGVSLCKDHYCIDAEHVLDPTMLLTKEDYLAACGLEMRDEDILSYYLLDNSESKMAIVRQVCSELNLQGNRVNTETENPSAPIKQRVAPSIEKWIGGFAHSKFIIADSFHATVFAILFNKPFITIANTGRGLARFLSLLSMVGLERRLVFSIDDLTADLINEEIEWNSVNERLSHKRQLSIDFLHNNLNK